MSETTLFGVVSLTCIVILFIYSVCGSFFEAKHFHLIHETGLGIILGILAGLLFLITYEDSINFLYDFNNEFFFYILLPVIIFSGGYNLNKRRFFQNFLYICLYGVLGTIISFLIIVICTIYVNKWGLITYWQDVEKPIDLNIYQIMIFSATICATDSVAALTMIKPEKYPKLFSVVFGEGMVNDAVSIIIYMAVGTIVKTGGEGINFYWYTSFQLLWTFIVDFVASFLIGIVIGLFTTWLFKTMRFLTHSCVTETVIIMYMGYVSFTICELIQLSGVISVLVTGVVLAHYNFYNISPIGKISSQVTIQTLSLVCESFIYIYLGLSIWTLRGTHTNAAKICSWTFVLLELFICLLARGISMIILSFITALMMGRKQWRLTFWEMSIIWFAGLIRGSIAYALIQQVEPVGADDHDQIEVLKSTILLMVIGTTIILGGLMPFYITLNMKFQQRSGDVDMSVVAPRETTLRDTFLGKGELAGESERSKKYRSKLQKLVRRVDENYVKPFFIFDYANRKKDINKSKKLKMNQPDFDDQHFGRFTIQQKEHGQSIGVAHVLAENNSESFEGNRAQSTMSNQVQRLPSQFHDKDRHPSQARLSKITLRSSFNSKFMGNQLIEFDLDLPMYEDDLQEQRYPSDIILEAQEDYESDSQINTQNGRLSINSNEKKEQHHEITIQNIVKKP